MRPPDRSGTTVAAILLVLTSTVSACSGGDDADTPSAGPDQSSTTSEGSGPPPLATKTTLGKITGKLPTRAHRHLKKSVGGVVDGWLDAAYVGGDYPRSDFRNAFPGFTSGAKADARQDRMLMSNKAIGKRIDGAVATKRRLRIDALVVRRKPVGVTARFILDFKTAGKVDRKIEVRGRLFLTRIRHGWRVFGYDVTKGAAR